MPKVSGIEVLNFTKKNKPRTKVVIISTYVNQKVIDKVMELCTDEYIEKSSFLKDIVRILDKITLRGDKISNGRNEDLRTKRGGAYEHSG